MFYDILDRFKNKREFLKLSLLSKSFNNYFLYKNELYEESLNPIIYKFNKLKYIKIKTNLNNIIDFNKIISKNIKIIDIINDNIDDNIIKIITENFINLKSLILKNNNLITNDGIKSLSNLNKLKTLNLINNKKIKDIECIINKLKIIYLNSSNINNYYINNQRIINKKLKIFSINIDLSPQKLNHILQNSTKLKELNFNSSLFLNNKNINLKFNSLEKLSFAGIPNFSGYNFPNLKSLTFSFYMIDNGEIIPPEFLEDLINLEELAIYSNCVNDLTFINLSKKIKTIKINSNLITNNIFDYIKDIENITIYSNDNLNEEYLINLGNVKILTIYIKSYSNSFTNKFTLYLPNNIEELNIFDFGVFKSNLNDSLFKNINTQLKNKKYKSLKIINTTLSLLTKLSLDICNNHNIKLNAPNSVHLFKYMSLYDECTLFYNNLNKIKLKKNFKINIFYKMFIVIIISFLIKLFIDETFYF